MKGREAKPHIGIYGRRNKGKSSLINRIAGQDIAIVSETAGTTTDPVKKSFEVSNVGPVIFIDTAGIDDIGDLGGKRVVKTFETLNIIDLAILIISGNRMDNSELNLVDKFRSNDIPFFLVHNKSDEERLDPAFKDIKEKELSTKIIEFSALQDQNTDQILEMIMTLMPETVFKTTSLIGDLISYGDIVLLITPVDIEAPEGRLILPQVQLIRDILDNDCVAIALKEREVDSFLRHTGIRPKLAITDSQVFVKADASIPPDIPLTSFSIVLAHYKGDFENYLKGTPAISRLKEGDRVLVLESCSHHVSCDDIGRVKIPRWISNYTGKNLVFDIVPGLSRLPADIKQYALVVQCGGCMFTRRQLHNRLKPFVDAGIPVTNYGMAIAWIQGIYHRAVAPFAAKNLDMGDYL